MKKTITIIALAITILINAQDKKVTFSVWEGVFIAGYVDGGAFANFGGPSVKWVQKPYSLGFGLLPSVRIKEDTALAPAKKNHPVTPTAGFGFTFMVKHLAIQVPFYYDNKTNTTDGEWNPGIGIGYKF